MRHMKPIFIATVFLMQIASAYAATPAVVQYRWRNHGAIQYGDVLPPNAGAIGYDILDGNGKLVRHVAPSINAVNQAAQVEAARAQYERLKAEQQVQAKIVNHALKQVSDDQMHALQTLDRQQSAVGDRIIAEHKVLDRMLSSGASPSSPEVAKQEAAIRKLEDRQQQMRMRSLQLTLQQSIQPTRFTIGPVLQPPASPKSSFTPERAASPMPAAMPPAPARVASGRLPISGGAGALSLSECTRLVHRTFFNIMFSKTSVRNSPFDTKMIASCMAGQSFFNRGYYNCVFSTKYSDTLDCAYAAKGIDRSKRQPILATRKVGEDGMYEGAAKEMEDVIYRGQDPRTTIDQITLDRYLDERDNIDRSLGDKPPADRNAPLRKSASHIDANGQTFWVVREQFVELQIAKVMHQDAKGTDNVFCVQFGDSRRLRLDQGYCSAMIEKYFHVALAD